MAEAGAVGSAAMEDAAVGGGAAGGQAPPPPASGVLRAGSPQASGPANVAGSRMSGCACLRCLVGSPLNDSVRVCLAGSAACERITCRCCDTAGPAALLVSLRRSARRAAADGCASARGSPPSAQFLRSGRVHPLQVNQGKNGLPGPASLRRESWGHQDGFPEHGVWRSWSFDRGCGGATSHRPLRHQRQPCARSSRGAEETVHVQTTGQGPESGEARSVASKGLLPEKKAGGFVALAQGNQPGVDLLAALGGHGAARVEAAARR